MAFMLVKLNNLENVVDKKIRMRWLMNVLHNHGYGLHTYIIFGEIHQSAVWIVGTIRVLGYVVAASFFVVSYADEAHTVVVCSASCLESLLSLLLCAGLFVGQFCHSTLKGESRFADITLPTYRMTSP